MDPIRHSDLFPDQSILLSPRYVKKDAGRYEITAPAATTHISTRLVAVGGQGENFGGNGAFARRKAKAAPGEVFELQVGQPGTGGAAGDSWLRRKATGEMLCYADRGRGTGGVQGDAAKCIGDVARSGVANVGSGSDASEPFALGFGGRPASARRAPGPGGGGQGLVYPSVTVRFPAGQGMGVVEFYAGDPGPGF